MARAGQPADHGRGGRIYLSGLFTFAVSRKHATANPVARVKLDEHKKTSKASMTPVTKAQIGDMATACRIIAAMGSGIEQGWAQVDLGRPGDGRRSPQPVGAGWVTVNCSSPPPRRPF